MNDTIFVDQCGRGRYELAMAFAEAFQSRIRYIDELGTFVVRDYDFQWHLDRHNVRASKLVEAFAVIVSQEVPARAKRPTRIRYDELLASVSNRPEIRLTVPSRVLASLANADDPSEILETILG